MTENTKITELILKLMDEGMSVDDIIAGLQESEKFSSGMATQAVVSAMRTKGINCAVCEDGETGEFEIAYLAGPPINGSN